MEGDDDVMSEDLYETDDFLEPEEDFLDPEDFSDAEEEEYLLAEQDEDLLEAEQDEDLLEAEQDEEDEEPAEYRSSEPVKINLHPALSFHCSSSAPPLSPSSSFLQSNEERQAERQVEREAKKEGGQEKRQGKNKCWECGKKCGLLLFECAQCGQKFCSKHRRSENQRKDTGHFCSNATDYAEVERARLAKAMEKSIVEKRKLLGIWETF